MSRVENKRDMKQQGKFPKIRLLVHYALRFGDKISDNYTAACAAQAAFFIMLSVVPLISLVLATTTYLPFSQQDVMDLVMRVIPNDLMAYVSDIINDLYGRASKTVISVSAIAMLWTASRGIAALMDGFNSMYQIREENSNMVKARLIAIVYTVIFILLFVVIMTVYVTVTHYYRLYIQNVFEMESLMKKLLLFIRYAMGWLLFYSFLLLLYVVLPGGFGLPRGSEEHLNLSKRIKSQMPGAAFAAVAWLVISRVVVIYIHYFPNFSIMYGSLAGIVIAMLWLYFCMYSIFIGAVINYLLSEGYLTRVKKMLK